MPLFSGATCRLPPGMPLRKLTARDPMKLNTIPRRLSLAVKLVLVYKNACRFILQWLGWSSPKPSLIIWDCQPDIWWKSRLPSGSWPNAAWKLIKSIVRPIKSTTNTK